MALKGYLSKASKRVVCVSTESLFGAFGLTDTPRFGYLLGSSTANRKLNSRFLNVTLGRDKEKGAKLLFTTSTLGPAENHE